MREWCLRGERPLSTNTESLWLASYYIGPGLGAGQIMAMELRSDNLRMANAS